MGITELVTLLAAVLSLISSLVVLPGLLVQGKALEGLEEENKRLLLALSEMQDERDCARAATDLALHPED